MKIGLGHLRMAPRDFWAMSLAEFFAASDGYLESKGVKTKGSPGGAPSQDEIDELSSRFDDQGRPLDNG